MQSSIIKLLVMLQYSVLVKADADTVVSDFNTINTNLNKLDVDVLAVPPGVVGIGPALQVSVGSVTVDDALIKTDNDVQASSAFSQSESQNILNAIGTVAITANRTLADVTKQRSALGGLSPVVLSTLYQLKQDQNEVGISLASKLDPSTISAGVQLLLALNTAFDAAIKAFQ